MTIKVPGKIFIAGEYAALKGLPAITVAVNPCFVFETDGSAEELFHPQSPAGLLKSQLTGTFEDPYHGVGGMGRSTAEYLVAASTQMNLKNEWQVREAYQKLLQSETNTPSGVDLLTQLKGGYLLSETSKKKAECFQWPFPKLDWIALITGNKVKTHEHLAKNLEINWELLKQKNQAVLDAFQQGTLEVISALNNWRQFLFESNLEVPATTELIEFFMEIPGVVAAKGCGALGSDVVFVLFEKEKSEFLEKCLPFWDQEQVIRSSQVCFEGLTATDENENVSTL